MGPLKEPRWEAFCHEYLVDQNASAAYLRVGYKGHGKMLRNRASRLLNRPEVQARIAELVERNLAATDLAIEDVFALLKYILTVDITSVVQWDEHGKPTYTPSNELTAAQRAAITKVTFTETQYSRGKVERVAKFETADKNKAIDSGLKLFSMLGMGGGAGGSRVGVEILQRKEEGMRELFEQINAREDPDQEAVALLAELDDEKERWRAEHETPEELEAPEVEGDN